MAQEGKAEEALAVAEAQDAAYPKCYALLGAAEGILEAKAGNDRKN